MNSNESNFQPDETVEIRCEDRWQVYHRLQELEISCWCGCYQPLKVQVTSVACAIQIWSVVKQVTMSRQTLLHWLEDCWRVGTFPERG